MGGIYNVYIVDVPRRQKLYRGYLKHDLPVETALSWLQRSSLAQNAFRLIQTPQRRITQVKVSIIARFGMAVSCFLEGVGRLKRFSRDSGFRFQTAASGTEGAADDL